jgi:hypothetical protein
MLFSSFCLEECSEEQMFTLDCQFLFGANQSFASGNSQNEIAGSTTMKNQIARQKSKTPSQKAGGKFHFVKPFPPEVKKNHQHFRTCLQT